MRYKPDITRFEYPEKPDQHMLHVKHQVDTNFDENYRYYNNTFGYKLLRFFANIIYNIIVVPILFFMYQVKIEGKENVKKAKKLKTSVMTISNHVLFLDYPCILKAIRPKLEYFMAWPVNLEGPNRHFIKLMGGIPIPSKIKALPAFSKAIENVIKDKHWLHVYPEGSMWYEYPYIRPLKKGCFKYAQKYNVPILPMAISFRERKGIFKLFFRKNPLVTVRVGEIMYVNQDLSRDEAIEDIQTRAFDVMQELAGIHKGDPDYQTLDNYKIIRK